MRPPLTAVKACRLDKEAIGAAIQLRPELVRPPPTPTPRTWLSNAPRAVIRPEGIGKEADAAYSLCEQALAIDPNDVRALMELGVKFWLPAVLGLRLLSVSLGTVGVVEGRLPEPKQFLRASINSQILCILTQDT
jgi:hypothetical protein